MWNKLFWKQSAERAVKSAAQSLLGLWALDGVGVSWGSDAQTRV